MTDYIRGLNWVDFIILFGLIRGAYVGYRSGALRELLRSVMYLITLAVLISSEDMLTDIVSDKTSMSASTSQTLVVLAVGLVTCLVLKIIFDLVLRAANMENNMMLKLFGLLAGMLRWVGLLSVLLWLIDRWDIIGLGSDIHEGSVWSGYIAPIAPTIIEMAASFIPQIGSLT